MTFSRRPCRAQSAIACPRDDRDNVIIMANCYVPLTKGLLWRSRLRQLHDTHPTSMALRNDLVAMTYGVVEIIETFSVLAILTPLARSR
jgi:hypothetical protein